jgi:uncharacterized protein
MSKHGFASLSTEERKRLASIGGKAAHAQGRAHEFTPEEARANGRRGGTVVSRDRKHMAKIGARGGRAKKSRKQTETETQERK